MLLGMTFGRIMELLRATVHKRIWIILSLVAVIDATYLATILIGHSYPCDFEVYRLAGESIRNQTSIYTTVTSGCHLSFTYTPFAAVLFLPFSFLGQFGFGVWTLLGAIALWRAIILIVKSNPIFPSWFSPTQQIAAVFLLILPLEPFVKTLWYGQVNLFILWLVSESFFGARTRTSGVYSALATAIKLTPGLFTLFLLFVKGSRVLWATVITFVTTVLIGFAIQPIPAWNFWSTYILSTDRVGPTEYLYNQSINGLLWRLLGEGGSPILWVLLSLMALSAGFWSARRLWIADQQLWAVSVIGLVTLFISPITWSHHYVLVIFPLVALAKDASAYLSSRLVMLVAYALLLIANFTFKVIPHGKHLEFNLNALQMLVANQYVILSILLLGFALMQLRKLSKANN